jgi:hypothetical protein
MPQKIYKLAQARPSEAWYQLSKDEQDEILAKIEKALEDVGGKRLVLCNALWSSEKVHFFGVEEFPDIEAEQKFTQLLTEFNWFRYVESETVLGTEWPPS